MTRPPTRYQQSRQQADDSTEPPASLRKEHARSLVPGQPAYIACPDRPVVTVVGDGGFLFAAGELATAVQHGIHTVTVVFDDGAYGNSNRDQREKYGGRELGTVLRNPDWVQLARAFGAEGVVVRDLEQMAKTIRAACEAETSTVIAVPMERLPSPF